MKPKIPLPSDAVNELGMADTSGLAPAIAAARQKPAAHRLPDADRRSRHDGARAHPERALPELLLLNERTQRSCVAAGCRRGDARRSRPVRGPDSDLSPAQKAALRLADAYLNAPAEMSDSAKQEVAANLSATQIVETVLKLMGFSNDKVMVALGLDFEEIKIFEM